MKKPKPKKISNLNTKNTITSYAEIKNIISQILFGEELKNILDIILLHIEKKLPKARASIFLYDAKNDCLVMGAAPSFTPLFSEIIGKIKIGPIAASCGTTAFYKTTTMIRDTHCSPLWIPFISIAKEYQIRASWSVPILNAEGDLLGTLALYHRTTHKPCHKEAIIVKELIDVIFLAIDRDRSLALKKQNEEEIQIQRTNALNSLKFASLGEMAKNISHEVNTPLAVMSGSVQQMYRIINHEQGDVFDKLKNYMGRLDRAAERIESIIKGLHFLTREASSDAFVKMDARSLIEDALSFYQERFFSQDIKIMISGDLNVVMECRSTQICQMLINLLNNSYEAINKLDDPWISIHIISKNKMVRWEVTDSGNGIPADIVDKIMIPLFTTKILSRATGLGLSVSQALAAEHGGKIWYDNSCMHTRFIIELPLVQENLIQQAV